MKAYTLDMPDTGKTSAKAARLTLAEWTESADAAAVSLHAAMMRAGAVDALAHDPESRAPAGYRYRLALPKGGVWQCGGVSLDLGSIHSRFDSPEAAKLHGLPVDSPLPNSVRSLSCKWNHHNAPAQNVRAVVQFIDTNFPA